MPSQFNDPAQILLQQEMLKEIKHLNNNLKSKSGNVVTPKGSGNSSMVNAAFDQVVIVDERGDRQRFFDLLEEIAKYNVLNTKTNSTANSHNRQQTTQNTITMEEERKERARLRKIEKETNSRSALDDKYEKEKRGIFTRMVALQSEGGNRFASLPKALAGSVWDSMKSGLRESSFGKIGQAFGLWKGEARLRAEKEVAAAKVESTEQRKYRKFMEHFTNQAIKPGSIFTHDIHLEKLLKILVGSFTPAEQEKNAKTQGTTLGKLLQEGKERNDLFTSLSDPRNNKTLKVSNKGFDSLAKKMTDMRSGKDGKSKGGLTAAILMILGILGLGAGLLGFGNLFKGVFKWLPKLASVTGLLGKAGGMLSKIPGIGSLVGGVGKLISKVAGKGAGKLLGKTLGKKIPGVGLAIGVGLAGARAVKGDYLGAAGELTSGVASLVPGIGTAVSFGIDALLALKDNWGSIGETFANIMKSLPDIAGKAFDIAKTAGGKILDAGSYVGGKLVSGITGLSSSISDWWTSSDNSIADTVSKGAIAVATGGVIAGKFLAEKGKDSLIVGMKAAKIVAAKGKDLLKDALKEVPGIASAISKKALSIGSSVSAAAKTIGGDALTAGGKAFDFVKDNMGSLMPMTTRQQTDVLVSEIRMLRSTLEEIFKTTALELSVSKNAAMNAMFAASESAGPLSNPSTYFSASPVGHSQTQMVMRS